MAVRFRLAALCALMTVAIGAPAQDGDNHFRLGGGYTYTERSAHAVNLWLQYQRGPVTRYDGGLVQLGQNAAELAQGQTTRATFLRWHPTLDLRGGIEDTMSAYLFDVHFDVLSLPWSYPTGGGEQGQPDPAGAGATWPMSLGFEADRNMNSLGFIGQLGWQPKAAGSGKTRIGVNPILYLGVQGGYKAKLRTLPGVGTGGDLDQSQEAQDRWFGRLVGSLSFELPLTDANRPLTWCGLAEGTWDFVNGSLYHRLSTELRQPFASMSHGEIDFIWDIVRYENGVGRPTFNEGQQLTTGVSVEF